MVLQASAYFNARTRLPLAKVVIVSGLFLYLRKISLLIEGLNNSNNQNSVAKKCGNCSIWVRQNVVASYILRIGKR